MPYLGLLTWVGKLSARYRALAAKRAARGGQCCPLMVLQTIYFFARLMRSVKPTVKLSEETPRNPPPWQRIRENISHLLSLLLRSCDWLGICCGGLVVGVCAGSKIGA